MKRRLFWKILLGFWFTFFAISQGVWLIFTLLRPMPEQSEYAQSVARMSVAMASVAVRHGGEEAVQKELATWPRDQRNQIEVRPATTKQGEGRELLAKTNVSAPDGTLYGVAYYARPLRVHGIPHEVIVGGAIGGLAFSAVLAWYLTLPIQRMRIGFGQLAQGRLSTRLGPAMGRRRDEIADLAHDFDRMAIRLEELVAARDRLLADVSHELRTPLARLNLAIGLARQDPAKLETSLDRIGGEVAKLDEMVGELLTLAKLESGHRGEEYFDFAEVVKGVVQDASFEAAAKGVTVDLELQDAGNAEWLAMGKGKLISRAVENIVRNAVRYSPNGGTVRASLHHDAGQFRLLVTDDGPGVPEESLGTLFKPFVQAVCADGAGFGLGLAIAQRAIAVHGGGIVARNRHPKGLEMLVSIPAVVPQSA